MHRLFVPGRLCLFGEHSDWAAGYRVGRAEIPPGLCLVTGTDQGLRARAERADGVFEVSTRLADGSRHGPFRIAAEPGALQAAATHDPFVGYAAGTAAEVLARHDVGGLRLRIESDLPIRRGMSSSAAVCVLVARAYGRLYDLALAQHDEMEIAYRGERRTGSECGRMDQICALGQRAALLRFDADDLDVEPVEPGSTLHLLIVDLRHEKDTRRILSDLNACFPDAPGPMAARVREALGPLNAELVTRAVAALRAGDAATLGALMREARERFDRMVAPACPELRAPRLHQVLAHAAVRELAHGGKGVGSQGDGCAQLVTRGSEQRARLAERLEQTLGVATLALTMRPGRPPRRGAAPPPA